MLRPLYVLITSAALSAAVMAQVLAPATLLNPTPSDYRPALALDGEVVHACGTGTGAVVHYAHSLDGGRTWPVREVPIAAGMEVWDIAADGDLVVVLAYDQGRPHTISSFDGGRTWEPPVWVTLNGSAYTTDPHGSLHVDGTNVLVVWNSEQSNGTIWSNRSTDGGRTFPFVGTPLDGGFAPFGFYSGASNINVFADGGTVQVLWSEHHPAGGTLFQRSTDHGATWLPQPRLVSSDSLRQRGAGGDGNLLVASTYSSGALLSADGGATWSPLTGTGLPTIDRIAIRGQDVLAIQEDVVTLGHFRLLIDVSRDGGTTWLSTPYDVSLNVQLYGEPHIAGDSFFVRALFVPTPLELRGAVLQSDNGGVDWRLVTNDASAGLLVNDDRAIAVTRPTQNATWAWVVAGHTAVGHGTPGTGGLEPRLEGHGLSTLGNTFDLALSNARPATLMAFVASFAPVQPTLVGSTTVWVQPPTAAVPLLTNFAGESTLTITVPTSTGLAGLTLATQAFALDPAAADGFAATRAVESWIR